MKKSTSLSFPVVVAALVFLGASSAFAQGAYNVNIDVPGTSIHANGDSATVNVDGVGTVKSDGSIDINTNGTSVTAGATGASVKVNSGNTSVTTDTNSNGGTNVEINAPGLAVKTSTGTAVRLGSSGATLSVVASKGLDPTSVKNVIALQGDSSLYIKTEDDMASYGKAVVENTPQVSGVEANTASVRVAYTQPGKLLGFIPVKMNAQVNVSASGDVSIGLPWYSFFVVKDTHSIETAVKQNLAQAKTQNQIMVSGETSLQPVEQARVTHVVAGSLAADTSLLVNGSAVSVKTGTASVEVKDGNVKIQY